MLAHALVLRECASIELSEVRRGVVAWLAFCFAMVLPCACDRGVCAGRQRGGAGGVEREPGMFQ